MTNLKGVIYMEYDKNICPVVGVEGFVSAGKQFDVDIHLPEDNRSVIIEQNIERDKYEERITALKNIMQDKQVSISIGVLWREQVDDLEALLKSADKLMYMEKEMYHKNRE